MDKLRFDEIELSDIDDESDDELIAELYSDLTYYDVDLKILNFKELSELRYKDTFWNMSACSKVEEKHKNVHKEMAKKVTNCMDSYLLLRSAVRLYDPELIKEAVNIHLSYKDELPFVGWINVLTYSTEEDIDREAYGKLIRITLSLKKQQLDENYMYARSTRFTNTFASYLQDIYNCLREFNKKILLKKFIILISSMKDLGKDDLGTDTKKAILSSDNSTGSVFNTFSSI